ncbi:vWA domain-containing protein [Kiloniella laminariae]|uniref:vWA domain-containing protein n=1 Tax=Kiloniella laminariae TaxID=454162 RepID=UPI000377522E|nr:VWA domain-containing protein [Kiloniella laminariae]
MAANQHKTASHRSIRMQLLRSSAFSVLLFAAACSPGEQNVAGRDTSALMPPPPIGKLSKQSSEPLQESEAGRVLSVAPGQDFYDSAFPAPEPNRENYDRPQDNPVKQVASDPVSTFSIDVDSGAYANTRRFIEDGYLPPADAVRVEELINYFSYDYPLPDSREQPFSVTTEVAPTPWNAKTKLVHIGIKAFDIPAEQRPAANLVFLVDVSGSMHAQDKLPLLQSSLRLMVNKMTAADRISLVTYAGSTEVVLPATSGADKAKIMAAIDQLTAGGSTNGGAGIRLAYAEAQKEFIEGGINRILLATDGDVNVGTVDFDDLKKLVEGKRRGGVSLTTLGFGTGNYNDHLLEQLADAGNGNHGYIDSLSEARKLLVEELSSTLITVAKDVKLQVEFNPAVVAEYRLVGYENRLLQREDFNNDKVDAGEIGAGHTVTALYEIALVGSEGLSIDPLRYGQKPADTPQSVPADLNKELAFLRVRYKEPDQDKSKLMEFPIHRADILSAKQQPSERFRFSAAVASFGQILRGSPYIGNMTLNDTTKLAKSALGDDPYGYRREFLTLIDLANSLEVARK